MGLTRARISQAERAETEGGVTLKTMHSMAQAMGCRFVYAIVPDQSIAEVIEMQARRKAKAIVTRASTHMALEDQTLGEARNEDEIQRLATEFVRTMPSDLWTEK